MTGELQEIQITEIRQAKAKFETEGHRLNLEQESCLKDFLTLSPVEQLLPFL
jgi:hypothetical protein